LRGSTKKRLYGRALPPADAYFNWAWEHPRMNDPDTRRSQAENGAQNERVAPDGAASLAASRYLMSHFQGFCAGKRQAREL
jgi:hypothetical protein